ncbi:hypothetical protein RvY_16599 [Ramazzottius varieornatus]|uniref:P-type domain-containing protein n=1 Tax=Ramazzottius varieornatus TaxID=947166 RepID=A0A1D1W1R1_RAMVA|nr:hypothetical protein RvY_16599 [Ramazzottius varieornatus]
MGYSETFMVGTELAPRQTWLTKYKWVWIGLFAIGWALAILFLVLGLTGVLHPDPTPVVTTPGSLSSGSTQPTSPAPDVTTPPASPPTSSVPTSATSGTTRTGPTSTARSVGTTSPATGQPLPTTTLPPLPTAGPLPEDVESRVECLPDEPDVSQAECESKGCEVYTDPNTAVSKCILDNARAGFSWSWNNTSGSVKELYLQSKRNDSQQLYSRPFVAPRVKLDYGAKSMFHFTIYDGANERYEVPVPTKLQKYAEMEIAEEVLYENLFLGEDATDIRVMRHSDRTLVWDMSLGGLVLEDQYLQITNRLSSEDCYGFGDNRHPHLKHNFDGRTWPMFSRDEPPTNPNTTANLYGVHPFYMCMEPSGNAHGVFLLNSNAMEYKFHNGSTPALTIRSIGGIFDFYIFMGPTPEDVIEQYTRLMGRPFMPPYWALGFQISRWGFTDLDDVKRTVNRSLEAKIPLDVVYGDIDYMAYAQDFTIDQENYAELPVYVDELHQKGMRYVIILDPFIHADAAIKHPQLPEYRPYTDGVQRDVFLKWPANITAGNDGIVAESIGPNKIILGKAWPQGRSAYPDFFKNETAAWWTDWIADVYNTQALKFDGIWLDMNEPTSWGTNKNVSTVFYCAGLASSFVNHTCHTLQCPMSSPLENPPYKPMAVRAWGSAATLADGTLCMTAQGRGKDGKMYNQYDVHSLYGWSQAEVTYKAAQTLRNQRSFVFSRSTYPGGGQYLGHWLGDNAANFEDMRYSIIGMLEYSMFGYSYIGADICGFWDDTKAELCTKWHALGAFYPFARNHNARGSKEQDPAYHPAVAHVARVSLNIRYTLLPYLYTLFHRAHIYGETVARPMHHVYPHDSHARSVDDQFFWGSALMISPVIDNTTDRDVYTAADRMYDYYDGYAQEAQSTLPLGSSWDILLEGWQNYTMNMTIDPTKSENKYVGLHLRPGYIIPTQDPAVTTTESRNNPFRLIITVDKENPKAEGELFWDDGISIDTYNTGNYYSARFSYDNAANPRVFDYTVVHPHANMTNMTLAELRIYTNVPSEYFDNLKFVVRSGAGVPRPTVLCTEWKIGGNGLKQYFRIFGSFDMSESFQIRIYTFKEELPSTMIDCAPDIDNVRECDCHNRACHWNGRGPDTNPGEPACVYPSLENMILGYKWQNENGEEATPSAANSSFTQTLTLYHANFALRRNPYMKVRLQITPISDEILRISFLPGGNGTEAAANGTDAAGTDSVPCFLAPWSCNITSTSLNPVYSYEVVHTDEITYVAVHRGNSSGPVIWSTEVGALVYAHQYREITTHLASDFVYGSGENSHNSFKHDMNFQTWGMWARDQPPGGRQNLYGSHPYVMVVEDAEGHAYGSLLLNSHAMEMAFTPTPAITYRTIGGHLDFFLFVGQNPSHVTQLYTSFIGKPFLPPFWALGFQISRYGYNTLDNMANAVDNTIRAGIPLDIFYGDVDYFDNETIFTISDRFAGLPEYVQQKNSQGVRFVTILDPFNPATQDNEPFQRGLTKRNAFIRWPEGYIDTNNQSYSTINASHPPYLLAHAWPPHKAVYTDFFHPEGRQWWSEEVEIFRNAINFSALWIDMNEPAAFGTNDDDVWYTYSPEWPWSLTCDINDPLESPQYIPRALETGYPVRRLSQKTICMNAVQNDGMKNYNHYNVHNLYGHSQIEPSLSVMHNLTGQRSFVVSRSTFVGSGAHAGHWTGDNAATWEQMAQSIIGMLEFNLFGIPYVGADICGFFLNTTENLCARWMQLGAFYPFARNHNGKNNIAQDPVAMGPTVQEASKQALDRRYKLLPYLYTLMADANQEGTTVVKSLMENFPTDLSARSIDKQFMWGECLLVTPVLSPNVSSVTGYLPEGQWYDYVTGKQEIVPSGTWKTFQARLSESENDMIPLHIRGGCIVPLQQSGANTNASMRTNYTLGIASKREGSIVGVTHYADGKLFWDGGLEIRDENSPRTDLVVRFHYQLATPENEGPDSRFRQGIVTIEAANGDGPWGESVPRIDVILIAGFPDVPDMTYIEYIPVTGNSTFLNISEALFHDRVNHVLRIRGANLPVHRSATVIFRNFGEPNPGPSTTSAPVTGQTFPTTLPPLPTAGPLPEDVELRAECLPDRPDVSQAECESKGCMVYADPNTGVTKCVLDETRQGYTWRLDQTDDLIKELKLTPKNGSQPLYSEPFTAPKIRLDYQARSMFHFTVYDDAKDRYRVPVPTYINTYPFNDPSSGETLYENLVLGEDSTDIRVMRRSDHTLVWDMSLGGLVLEDQYLQITNRLASKDCYGFGDNRHPNLKHNFDGRTWPMFSRDEPPTNPGAVNNLYGVHPFYMCMEPSGNAHGVFLLNSNAMEYKFHNSSTPALTIRSIGGIFDFYIFMGPKPEDVIEQYTRLMGRPFLPPYWALGFQISRWGFEDLDEVNGTVQRNIEAKIPLDAVYGDIDYMAKRQDFTIDQEKYGNLPAFVNELHAKGMRYVIILDPAIHADAAVKHPELPEYKPYTEGLEQDVFIKWPANYSSNSAGVHPDSFGPNKTMLGKVWPDGRTAFPDFFKADTRDWWTKWIRHVYKEQNVTFDALWIDMNEVSSFDTNKDPNTSWYCNKPDALPGNHTCFALQCPTDNQWDNPPYNPVAARNWGPNGRLSDKTVCMIAEVTDREGQVYKQYDVHSLYGWSQAEVTYQAAQDVRQERSFVFSRSTYPGGQQYVGHWLGDNAANFEDMRYSIIGMLEYSMFGYSYIGADICGFWDDTSVELCTKWHALGAFYPFARNHNAQRNKAQDPAYHPAVAHVARTTLNLRYTFLPYLYTLFYRAHVSGETVARPLHHVYPQEQRTYSIDDQFFWGPALMISPVVDNSTDRDVYIPAERMYDYYDGFAQEAGSVLPLGSSWNVLLEGWLNYTTNMTIDPTKSANKYVGLHLRPGFIIPTQDPAVTTTESRKNPFRLIITVDEDHPSAEGELFWDDGVGVDTVLQQQYYHARFSYNNQGSPRFFNYTVIRNQVDMSKMKIEELRIYTNVQSEYFESLQFIIRSGAGVIRPSVLCTEWKIGADGNRQYFRIFGPFEMHESFQIQIYKFKDQRERTMIDCTPDVDNLRECDCYNRGCVWKGRGNLNPGEPVCVYPQGYLLGYRSEDDSAGSISATNASHTRTLALQNEGFAVRRGPYPKLRLQITPVTDEILRISFTAAGNNGDPAGDHAVPCFLANWACVTDTNTTIEQTTYSYEVNNTDDVTAVSVRRRSSGRIIWSTDVGALIYAHQYREITTKLPSEYVYGSGENTHNSFKHDMNFRTWGMWARDQPPGGRQNLYGVHPYVMVIEDNDGHAFGSLLLNSNAMEMAFTPTPAITYRTIGGHLDFFLFVGQNPAHVTQLYTGLIGRPFLPPFWALGFQLSRYGYDTFENMEKAVEDTIRARIPLDVFYGDIDYFQDETDFTIGSAFAQLPAYVNNKLRNGVRFVTILDPCNPALESNEAFQRGLTYESAFIRWPAGYIDPSNNSQSWPSSNTSQGPFLLGHVWPPAKSVFADFFHPSGRQWWADEVSRFHSNISFSALWIDMNEPANFGTNGDDVWYTYSPEWPWSLQCDIKNPLESPQYIPRALETGYPVRRLSQKTICMNAVQNDGVNNYDHYNVHSLYGHSQIQPSLDVMQSITGNRSFVFSRSTFVGSGAKAGHWLGDNSATWEQMAQSIIGMLEFNLFGIPYVGADICGFFGDSRPDLCARWMQLGAFYPFARNHNGKGATEQHPSALGPLVEEASRQAMDRRYKLLPYLYTLFHNANQEGITVVKSLMENFPRDLTARSIDKQFMWGECLLITPVLTPNANNVTGYFPEGQWYDYATGKQEISTSGMWKTLRAVLTEEQNEMIPLHIRGGCIVPLQQTGANTKESMYTSYTLGIASKREVNATGISHSADGKLFWDGGLEIRDESSPSTDLVARFHYELSTKEDEGPDTRFRQGIVTIEAANGDGPWGESVPRIDVILIAGFPDVPDMTYIEYIPVTGNSTFLDINSTLYHDRVNHVLRIRGANLPVHRSATVIFRNYGEPNPTPMPTIPPPSDE